MFSNRRCFYATKSEGKSMVIYRIKFTESRLHSCKRLTLKCHDIVYTGKCHDIVYIEKCHDIVYS
jgi:hypothetical protein